MGRETPQDWGFGRSDKRQFVIGGGADGSAVSAVDLGRNYGLIVVRCADADGIDSSTTMTINAGMSANDTLCSLCEMNDPNTPWSKSVPATGTFQFLLREAMGVQRLQFILSKVTTAPVTLEVYGFSEGYNG